MRIIRFIDEQGNTRLGEETQEGSARILTGDLYGQLKATDETAAVAKLLAPIEPINIFCIGRNYREHAEESGIAPPTIPVVFMKPTSTLTHPGDPIRLPACQTDEEVDYECELAVIIGKTARDVSESEALEYVLGYTCGHDVSARHWQLQFGGGQWIRGKGFDTFCPLGPTLVTSDEIPDPQDLVLETRLNGAVMQHTNTDDMTYSVREIISYCSTFTDLVPGDIIPTGTPSGVTMARTPPAWMKPGDVIEVDITKIGVLRNPIESEA